jgi:hypothetical protein
MSSGSSKPPSPSMAEDVDAISVARATPNTAPPETLLADKAAKFISEHGEIAFSYDDERAVLKRVDMRILPLLLGAYFFQQLDKSSLSYVSIFGIIEDANLTSRKIFKFP